MRANSTRIYTPRTDFCSILHWHAPFTKQSKECRSQDSIELSVPILLANAEVDAVTSATLAIDGGAILDTVCGVAPLWRSRDTCYAEASREDHINESARCTPHRLEH
eukprot:5301966-Amphidinium_carterae.1